MTDEPPFAIGESYATALLRGRVIRQLAPYENFSYTIGYAMLSDVEGVIASGYFVVFPIAFMFLILLPQFIANYLYAFRSKHLWANAP